MPAPDAYVLNIEESEGRYSEGNARTKKIKRDVFLTAWNTRLWASDCLMGEYEYS